MRTKKFEHHKERWKNMAKVWRFYTKPSRPSQQDVQNYKDMLSAVLRGITKPTIVVLGATPEIRDLLFGFSKKKETKIICVDMTKSMYLAMSRLMRRKNPMEKFVASNWLEMSKKIKRGSVDAVIGDFVMGNIGGFEDKFLKEITQVLKPGGHFVTRVYFHTSYVKKNMDFRKELKRLAKKVSQGKYSVKEAKEYFLNNTLFTTWHIREDNKISQSYASEKYEELEKQRNTFDPKEKRIFDAFWKYWWPAKEKYWTNLPEPELEKIFKKHFMIKEKNFSHDYELAPIFPTYLLKKKS